MNWRGCLPMIDLPSVHITGAIRFARARVLWHQGLMKLYTKSGKIAEMQSSEPQRLKGWRRVWLAETEHGEIRLSAKCSSCGGWSKVARPDAEALWQS